jgi:hypothetical protein
VLTLTLMLAAQVASGGVPDGIRPVVVPIDAPAQYAAFVEGKGGSASPLACRTLWEGYSLLCFRVWERSKRRWVTEEDLQAWTVSVADLETAVAVQAREMVSTRFEVVPVEGMASTYLRLTDGDGWAASGGLAPEGLAKRLGVPFLAAIPAEGVFVAWAHGDPKLDHVMAVGVRELYDEQPGGVSPFVHAWDGQKWLAFGEAKPSVATPGAPH